MVFMEFYNVLFVEFGLVVVGVMNIIGGLMLIVNRYVCLVLLGFVVYIVLVNYFLYDFWNFLEFMV